MARYKAGQEAALTSIIAKKSSVDSDEKNMESDDDHEEVESGSENGEDDLPRLVKANRASTLIPIAFHD